MIRNIQAALVLAGAIAAWVLVPEEILLPAAALLLAASIGGVIAIRFYMTQLEVTATGTESGKSIRERQDRLADVGVGLALVGLAAFLILVLEYAD